MSDPRARPDSRVALRYLAFQAPGWAVAAVVAWLVLRWGLLPAEAPRWAVWAAVGVWILKDWILFPFVWRAYLPSSAISEDGRVGAGALGKARQALDDSGYVEIGGELWRARCTPESPPVAAGDSVRVVDREGLTLLVERAEDGDR